MSNLKQVLDDIKHIGPIADSMAEWDGTVGDALELSYADREEIPDAHRGKLGKQKRMALMKWKQKKGNQATFENLIKAFESIGYKQYADNVRRICKETTSSAGGGGAQASVPPTQTSPDQPPSYLSAKVKPNHLQIIKWEEGGKKMKLHLMEKISDKWRKFGELLEIEDAQLEGIGVQHQNNVEECCRAVLKKWRENPPAEYPATWAGLIELLDDSQLPEIVTELKDALSKANL